MHYHKTQDTGTYSQLGYVVVIAHKDTLLGKPGQGVLATWKSHAGQRVCRSTFASEAMAASEGWEAGITFRDLFRGCFRAGCLGDLHLVSMTGCSFDSVHCAGGPRAPAEKRLLVNLAALRQMAQQEFASWSLEPTDKGFFWEVSEVDPDHIPTCRLPYKGHFEGRLVGPLTSS